MRDCVGFNSMRRVTLRFIGGELGFDLCEVIEMARAGAFEFAPQFVIVDRGAARFEKIACRRCSHQTWRQLISATWRIKHSTRSRAASSAGCSGAWERKL